MNDLDDMLRQARLEPRRDLQPDLTARVVSEITNGKAPSRFANFKEILTMKFIKKPVLMAAIIVVAAMAIGGGTYAAFHNYSLTDLGNMMIGRQGVKGWGSIEEKYRSYVADVENNKADAFNVFLESTTSELAAKLRAERKQGYDPILCGQNTPTSIDFYLPDNVSEGMARATLHYGSGTTVVSLNYDSASEVFIDIVCPVEENATGIKALQGYYQTYRMTLDNRDTAASAMEEFKKHATPELAAKLEIDRGYDPVLCAQDIPAMIDFKNVTGNSMDVTSEFYGGGGVVTLKFDAKKQVFTDIQCHFNQQ